MLGHTKENGATKVKRVLKAIINDNHLKNEINEVIASSPKRPKKAANSDSTPNQCSTLLQLIHRYELSKSKKEHAFRTNGKDHISTSQTPDEHTIEILNDITNETPPDHIALLLSTFEITIKDLFSIDPDTLLHLVPKIIQTADSHDIGSRLFDFMNNFCPQFLIRLLHKSLSEPSLNIQATEYCILTNHILVEVTTCFMQEQHSQNITEIYSSVLSIQNQSLYQHHRSKLENWYKEWGSNSKIFDRIKNVFLIGKVNPMHSISVLLSLLAVEPEQVVKLTTEVITDSINTCNSFLFILQLVLLRLYDQVGKITYGDSYKSIFGPSSTSLTSTRNVEFVLGQFIKLVPYEVGAYLKYHVSQPLKGGAKMRDKFEEYLMVAKTRMKDFKAEHLDSNVVNEVIKSVESFNRTKKLPMSIKEASIFKKQYFTNYFLPCLLQNKEISDLPGREGLVKCIQGNLKVPESLLKQAHHEVEIMEVEQITPHKMLSDDIEKLQSIPRNTTEFSKLADSIYSQFCVLHNRELLKKLIVKCFAAGQMSDCDTRYLKRFFENKMFHEDMNEIMLDLLQHSASPAYFSILSAFELPDTSRILRQCLIRFEPLYATKFIDMMNSKLKKDFRHLVLVGGSNIPIEASNCNVEALCEALSWFKYANYTDFLHRVTEIFEAIFRDSESITAILKQMFKCCLSNDILPLLSPSIVTAYSMIPDDSSLTVYELLADVLLPLYQAPDKPVATIKYIFRNFFTVILLLNPTLLYKDGSNVTLDNIVSVLDSYKRYVTSSDFTIKLTVLVVIVKAFKDDRRLFEVLCERSSLLVVSCVYYYPKLDHHSAIKNSHTVTNAIKLMEKVRTCQNAILIIINIKVEIEKALYRIRDLSSLR